MLTSPISNASSAEYILQRNHISLAFFGPTRLEEQNAETAVEAADPWADLPELRVIGGDGEVAHHVQDVTPAYGVSCHHRDDGFGATPDLDVQIRDVEAPDGLSSRSAPRRVRIFEVSGISPYLLVSSGTESVRSFPRQDDDPCLEVLPGIFESTLHLDNRQGTEGVTHLRTVYGDLRDPLRLLVLDVLELSGRFPHYVSHGGDYMGSEHPLSKFCIHRRGQ